MNSSGAVRLTHRLNSRCYAPARLLRVRAASRAHGIVHATGLIEGNTGVSQTIVFRARRFGVSLETWTIAPVWKGRLVPPRPGRVSGYVPHIGEPS